VEILLGAPGRVFSREELCSRAYRDSFVSDRTIDSHIRKIRSKFSKAGAQPIETVRSIGYKIASCR
jgi:two-component system OmpR family response regulator